MKWNLKHSFFCLLMISLSSSSWAVLSYQHKITGLEGPALKNVENRLKISERIPKRKQLTQKTIFDFFEAGSEEIKKAIQPYGYFKPTIKSELSQKNDTWTAIYDVTQGPVLQVTELTIKITGPGAKNKYLNQHLKKIPLKISDPFNVKFYHKAEDILLNAAQKQGFLRGKLTKNVVHINLEDYSCAITIVLDTGPQFYFGPLSFSKTPLNDRFLHRYVFFKPGDPFSYEKLLNFQQILSGSGYFNSVSVVPDEGKAIHYQVPTTINLEMAKRKQYSFGLGYGTTSGLRTSMSFTKRWVNQWGHQFRANLLLSHIENYAGLQYIIPGKDPAHIKYILDAGLHTQQPKRGSSTMIGIGFSQMKNYTRWQRTISLNLERERYRLKKHVPFRYSTLLYPTLSWIYTRSDGDINIKNGSRFSFAIKAAAKELVSSTSFLQTDVQYKWIKTLGKNNRIILRGDFGYTTVHDLDKLPLSKHFYTGGMSSIRGYGYKSIGPGRYLVIGSAELQHRIKGDWYGAIFYDIGNAMNHFDESYREGTGIGAIWQSPIGAVQVYVATALSDKGYPIRLEFSIGPEL